MNDCVNGFSLFDDVRLFGENSDSFVLQLLIQLLVQLLFSCSLLSFFLLLVQQSLSPQPLVVFSFLFDLKKDFTKMFLYILIVFCSNISFDKSLSKRWVRMPILNYDDKGNVSMKGQCIVNSNDVNSFFVNTPYIQ